MNILKEIYLGFKHNGAMPKTAVSDNENLYGKQGKKHLDEIGAPGLLNGADTRVDRRSVLTPKEQASNTEWNQQKQLAQMATRRHA